MKKYYKVQVLRETTIRQYVDVVVERATEQEAKRVALNLVKDGYGSIEVEDEDTVYEVTGIDEEN